MEFSFKAEVVLRLKNQKGESKSKHDGCDFNITPSDNLDPSFYLDRDGLPTKDGSKVFTTVLISGLAGNIHLAHEKGWKDSAVHLREIISELERHFVEVPTIKKGNFNDQI